MTKKTNGSKTAAPTLSTGLKSLRLISDKMAPIAEATLVFHREKTHTQNSRNKRVTDAIHREYAKMQSYIYMYILNIYFQGVCACNNN